MGLCNQVRLDEAGNMTEAFKVALLIYSVYAITYVAKHYLTLIFGRTTSEVIYVFKGEQFIDVPYVVKGMDVFIEAAAIEKLKNNEYLHALKLFPLVDNNWYNWPLQFCLAANKTQKRYLAIHVELWMIRCFLVHEFYLSQSDESKCFSTSKCDIFALELIIVVDAQDMFECPWNVDNGFILFMQI
ncbi:hypothetical protein ACJX0J_036542 [Zea mays]